MDSSSKKELEIENSPSDGITRVTYHKSENLLLASSWDSNLYLYNTDDNKLLHQVPSPASLLDCAFYTSKESLLSVGLDRNVTLYNTERKESTILGTHDHAVRCVRFYEAVGLVYSGGWDRTVRAWDPRAQTHWVTTSNLTGKVYAMAISEMQGYILVGTSNKDVLIYDVRNLQDPIMIKESPLKYQTRYIECMQNGQGYAISSIEGRVCIEYFSSDPEIQAKKYSFKCHREETTDSTTVYPVNTIAFHPRFGTFATGGTDGIVNVWDGENKKRLWKLRQYHTGIASLAFNSAGNQLAIAASYMYEQGELDSKPEDKIFIRSVEDADVMPKSKS